MELTRWTPARPGEIPTLYSGEKYWTETREYTLVQVHPLSHLAPDPHHGGPSLHRPRLYEPPDIPRHQAEQTGQMLQSFKSFHFG